jgi:hypothetical protein
MIGLRFSSTLSGLNGTRPVALKPEVMLLVVIICFRAIKNVGRNSSFVIWLMLSLILFLI